MTGDTDPKLTRRDALAALAAAGVTAGTAGCNAIATDRDEGTADGPGDRSGPEPPFGPVGQREFAVLTAAAGVLYPGELDGIDEFVAEFVSGRATEQPDHAAGIAEAARYVEEWSRSWMDEGFVELDRSDREAALDRMGAREADPDPDGGDVERVRYYVVNELLFALYSSPTGGKLVGIENPQGYPGGAESYRRGPQSGE
ncbi:MAG: gluconate 2-dehydrogenase subunit 3 family protein [Halosimplex sp.]